MVALIEPLDFYGTRKNAKNTLKHYRRLERIAGRAVIDLRSPIMSDMPKCETTGNKSEDALIQYMDAEAERNAIIAALMALPLISRQILYYVYVAREASSNQAIACELGYSVRQIERIKSDALIEFAEAYRKGRLLCYHK